LSPTGDKPKNERQSRDKAAAKKAKEPVEKPAPGSKTKPPENKINGATAPESTTDDQSSRDPDPGDTDATPEATTTSEDNDVVLTLNPEFKALLEESHMELANLVCDLRRENEELRQGTLSKSEVKAVQKHKAKLDEQFHAAVNARVQEFLENTIMPKLQAEQAEARRVMESRKGIMDKKAFRKIVECLHSDRVTDSELKPKYDEAFIIFKGLEKRLLNEKDSPTPFVNVPTTRAEWDELKRQATERKKSKRNIQNGIASQ
jgi:hypothetical protein